MWYNVQAIEKYGLVAQLGERTVRIREVRGFDPLRVHHLGAVSKGIHEKRVKITAAVPKNVS